MDLFNYVVAGLESKEFGDEKFYFNRNGDVVAIEHRGNISYVVYDKKADDTILITETNENYSLKIPIDMRKLFIIPEIDKLEDTSLIHICKTNGYGDVVSEMPESIYVVADYGIVSNSMCKGCDFSRSLIKIVVQSLQGKTYSVPFKVEEGVHGGDEYIDGIIPESYSMNPIGILMTNGRLIISP